MNISPCRFCGTPLHKTFVDLGVTPLANSFVPLDRAKAMEPFYPLHVYVCDFCRLVQLEEFESPGHIFSDYLYFSSFSDTWLRHAESYTAEMTARMGLGPASQVVEIASNDGYLLQYFHRRGIPVLGVEPAANVAKVAISKGIPTEVTFFTKATAERLREAGKGADLICANNVLAHAPNINDFVSGFKALLKRKGTVTVEFPHLLNLMRYNQFDTIYHEHFFYLSLWVVEQIFEKHGMTVFDVDMLPTHGGSLRVYARHQEEGATPTARVMALRQTELEAGLDRDGAYERFAAQVVNIKLQFLDFVTRSKRDGKRIIAYGAAAKGNTFLNYCGIGPEFVDFTVDRSPHKRGMLLPGTRIPVRAPEAILKAKPDYVLILPWNLRDEIMEQMAVIRGWGGQFVVAIPSLQVT